jgi:hypothetical protein
MRASVATATQPAANEKARKLPGLIASRLIARRKSTDGTSRAILESAKDYRLNGLLPFPYSMAG